MKKPSKTSAIDLTDMPELTKADFRRGVVGKYYRQLVAESNVVRIAGDSDKAVPERGGRQRGAPEAAADSGDAERWHAEGPSKEVGVKDNK
ncbi:MAG: hypothetical protein QM770_10060 [Tepidisphaeraceae bacterium]